MQTQRPLIAVIGGGAAGFFGAIHAAESNPGSRVIVLEKSPELLAKVAISGGGRCNVTHACFDPKRLAGFYPRGGRELIGPFHRLQPRDTMAWFETRGVPLKTEADGRVFPQSDRSESVTDCLVRAARQAGVELRTRCGASSIRSSGKGFAVGLTEGEALHADRILIATGGNTASGGFELAASLGHVIEPPVPSLFTFHIRDDRLEGLSGIAVSSVSASAEGIAQEGPLLITHWGLSGPAILKLSAWGARIFHALDYRFALHLDWVPALKEHALLGQLQAWRKADAAKALHAHPRFGLPARLWCALLRHAGVGEELRWSGLSTRAMNALVQELKHGRFAVDGRSLNKDEFVTCGGVRLVEVDFRSMESRRCPGLFFAGEVLDVDGLTGGFNLQAAWTTGAAAGRAMGSRPG